MWLRSEATFGPLGGWKENKNPQRVLHKFFKFKNSRPLSGNIFFWRNKKTTPHHFRNKPPLESSMWWMRGYRSLQLLVQLEKMHQTEKLMVDRGWYDLSSLLLPIVRYSGYIYRWKYHLLRLVKFPFRKTLLTREIMIHFMFAK